MAPVWPRSEETITFTISKPYPNFHSARIKSPGLFLRVRVFTTTKEGIMIYGGPLKSDPRGPTKRQAIRFPKDKFTVAQAKKWLKDHKVKYILFEPATGVKKSLGGMLWKRLMSVSSK